MKVVKREERPIRAKDISDGLLSARHCVMTALKYFPDPDHQRALFETGVSLGELARKIMTAIDPCRGKFTI